MKKKNKNVNYLDKIPQRNEFVGWKCDENDIITLEVENKGFFNKLFQLILKKPKISYIHLDKLGSFIWKEINGELSVFEIGEKVKNTFKDEANPLYERLCKYFDILKSYNFIQWK